MKAEGMMADENIIKFPEPPKGADLLIGPFQHYKVVVDGRSIPRLTGHPDGDGIALVLDHRFSATFPPDLARQAAWLIANALAVGQGYSHMGAANKDQPFAPIAVEIDGIPHD